MKRSALLLMLMLGVLITRAQYVPAVKQPYDETLHWGSAFQHLDVYGTISTMGIGIGAATPLGEDFRLRAGINYMPPLMKKHLHCQVYVGDDNSHFADVQELMFLKKGYEMQDNVAMTGKWEMFNGHVLVDYFPLDDDKKFRITAGFFFGPSRIAKITTDTGSAATLACIASYNNMFMEAPDDDPILQWGLAGLYMGTYGSDVVDASGNILHQAGDPYLMMPDEDGLTIDVKTNAIKPYLGVGYELPFKSLGLQKKKDTWKLAFDAGVLFWGGSPSARVSSDGIDLVKDIDNIPGEKGDYIKKIKKYVVYPNIGISVIYHIF